VWLRFSGVPALKILSSCLIFSSAYLNIVQLLFEHYIDIDEKADKTARPTHIMDYETASFIARAHRRKKVLESLSLGAKSPKQVAKECKTSASNVYRSLKELEERGLIVCKTPGAYTFKFYSITEKGKEIVEFLRAGKL
jgi:DNA-binding MarR family transcriptional regulator